ncbi:tRNA (adenosine(37)-N6)-dimethylallyltransferase MiaA [Dongia rigui]|uniref:tRNA dimethylallyltransferase n=1 Tax=Dongia rigui TaxID=940149 RepID=A0ABU5DTJ3_9PROT|nr:tRNA (adenosine(37)-N6)-dimethylallyltransferase MiaA [Dongia rigui]MDY0870644.1 tRNA (adenosine(37)-N6)-dimethylallyltransferase MiaA [Dongia rigui]
MADKDKAGRVVILAGPTASGKSALALDLAEALDGTIINADSMQVYRDLPILTAQPDAIDQARVPHRLYGFLDIDDACDAQRWAQMAAKEIDDTLAAGRVPMVVGGTGLYIRALMTGFSPMPGISAAIRETARQTVLELGPQEMHRRLAERDPVTAARLIPSDRQRIARAWEVLEETGQPLSWWQAQSPVPLTPHRFLPLVIAPERADLYTAVDARFAAMVGRGALDEVARAETQPHTSEGGGRKALGYPELAAVADGRMTLAEALPAAQQATRRYAKRQLTWFRHQVPSANFISPDLSAMKFSQSSTAQTRQKIRDFLLTP